MVRSLRLDPELDEQVQRAAAVAGESVSEFIRQAAAQRAQETLAGQGRERLADVVGVVTAAAAVPAAPGRHSPTSSLVALRRR